MDNIFNILYRLARHLSGIRPDIAAMIFAALHPPGLLVWFLLWIAEGLAMDLLKSLLLSPLALYAWYKLTPEERCFLIGLWNRFLFPSDRKADNDN